MVFKQHGEKQRDMTP